MSTEETEESDADLGSIFADLSNVLKQFKDTHGDIRSVENHASTDEPLTIKEIMVRARKGSGLSPVGSWVAVRPVSKPKDNETYVGILLGDLYTMPMVNFSDKSGTLFVDNNTNPAIWVPDLNRIVWGMESWWGVILSEKDLKKITDQTIENVWYVKALKSLAEEESTDDSNS